MTDTNKFVQGYVILNKVTLTDKQKEELNQIKRSYLLEFEELKTIGTFTKRTLYYLCLRDCDKIDDVFNLFSSRNPEIIGVWDIEGNIIEGYTFKKDKYMPYLEPIRKYSESGELISETARTEPIPIRLFSGFSTPFMG